MTLLIVIYCTFIGIKNNIFFLKHESVYFEACNFLDYYLAKLSASFFLSIRILNKTINEHTDCYLKVDDTLLKITIRGLLIKMLEVLSIPRMR